MESTVVAVGPALVAVVAGLTVLGAAIAAAAHFGHGRNITTAAVRAGLQLTVIAALITAILDSLVLAALFVAAMYAVATATAGRRMHLRRQSWRLLLPIAGSSLPIVVALVALRLVPAEPLVIIPVSGILIGGAMTATALAGRRVFDELDARHGEVEAGLALGLVERDARLEIVRPAAAEALIPVLDQTRTVGLVTLPGAFVGMLLGGASPLAAAAVQLLVLVALLAVETAALAAVVELVATGGLRQADPSRASPSPAVTEVSV